uniref:Uncharacterized protein n=1 Tax=Anguilla anguilla TaxID=7936 RepID=A0A0E9XUG5_ANGAN
MKHSSLKVIKKRTFLTCTSRHEHKRSLLSTLWSAAPVIQQGTVCQSPLPHTEEMPSHHQFPCKFQLQRSTVHLPIQVYVINDLKCVEN